MKKYLLSVILFCLATNSFAQLTKDLVAWYPLTVNANDSSGNGNNGTIHSGVTLTTTVGRPCQPNHTFHFNGTDSGFISCPNDSQLFKNTKTLSYSLWFKVNHRSSGWQQNVMFSNDNHAAVGGGVQVYIANPPGNYATEYRDSTLFGVGVMGATTIDSNTWYNLIGIIRYDSITDNTTVIHYLNGVYDDSITGKGWVDFTKVSLFYIGTNIDEFSGFERSFLGYIQDLRLWKRALDTSDIKTIFNNFSGTALTVQPTSVVCYGYAVTLTVPPSGINYLWTPSAGLNDTTGDSVVATPSVTTIYNISGTDSLGCPIAIIDTVIVKPVTPLVILPLDTSFCNGQSATLYVSDSGSDFIWTPSTGLSVDTGSSVVANPVITTIYTVTGMQLSGCLTSGFDTVTILQAPSKPSITKKGYVLTSSATQGNQWVRNDTVLTGATNQSYTITIGGYYQVITKNPANGCSATSDSIDATLSGINQPLVNSNQVSVYPNPTTGDIFISINSSVSEVKDWHLQITNVLGQPVYMKPILNYNNDIDLSNLSSGVYFIAVMNKTDRTIIPFIKQN